MKAYPQVIQTFFLNMTLVDDSLVSFCGLWLSIKNHWYHS